MVFVSASTAGVESHAKSVAAVKFVCMVRGGRSAKSVVEAKFANTTNNVMSAKNATGLLSANTIDTIGCVENAVVERVFVNMRSNITTVESVAVF